MGAVVDINGWIMGKDETLVSLLEISELKCEHIEVLVDYYIDEELPPTLLVRFQSHLEQCQECRTLVEDIRTLVGLAHALSAQPLPPGVHERLQRRLYDEQER
jgi:anti-sigma factor RsiW